MSRDRQVNAERGLIRKMAFWTLVIGLLALGGWAGSWVHAILAYDDLIQEIASEWDVDPRLVRAVAWQESRMRPDAVGGVGERGLMQVTEPVGREWAALDGRSDFEPNELFDPDTNLRAGTWYLARALDQWADREDPVPYALAQYNAGRTHALRWAQEDGGDPRRFIAHITFPATRAYVVAVQRSAVSRFHPLITQFPVPAAFSRRSIQAASVIFVLGGIALAIARRRMKSVTD